MTMRTPFRQVSGLGAAKSGTGHFWHQRLTGLLMLPLMVLCIALILSLLGKTYVETLDALARPVIAIPVFVFIAAGIYHMQIGMQVIIEDYVHGGAKVVCLVLNNVFALLVGFALLFAVLKISFGM
jgi:succinate dehydrogenase / fumarate reductase, membrane anchor subunit